MGESSGVKIVDLFPGPRPERGHAAVARSGRLLVERRANPECQLARAAVLIDAPSGREAIPFRVARDAALHANARARRLGG